MYKCSSCKKEKDAGDFYKSSSRSRGVSSYCKECNKLWVRKRYLANKTYYDDKNKIALQRNRIFVFNYLKNHPCVVCGESDPIVLDFDHLRDKITNISNMVGALWCVQKIKEEIDKCQVLCANCHRRKTSKQLGFFKSNAMLAE